MCNVCSTPEPYPCWNTRVITPTVAPSDSAFITIALIGTISEPVIRNSSTSMASTVMPIAHGSRSLISPTMSLSSAASPVTQDCTPAGRSARIWCTRSRAAVPSGSPAT